MIAFLIAVLVFVLLFPKIIDFFGQLDFSDQIHPGPAQKEEQQKKSYTLKNEKADWYTTQGRGVKENQVGEKTFESTYIETAKTERNPRLTDADIQGIESAGLDQIKAARVKILWAQGKSAETSANEIAERGYGSRTLDKYWAVFNQNDPK